MYHLSNCTALQSILFPEHFILNISIKQPMFETTVNKLSERLDDSWSLNLLYLSSQRTIPSFIQHATEDTRSLPMSFSRNKLGSFPQLTPTCWALWRFSTFVFEVSREAIRETQAFMCKLSLTSAFIIEADAHTVSLSLFQSAL